MPEALCFYVPCANKQKASELIDQLLHLRLIACGNILASDSRFVWDFQLNTDPESIVFMKTLPHLEYEVEQTVAELHSYEVPCIARWTIRVNEAYWNWLKDCVKP